MFTKIDNVQDMFSLNTFNIVHFIMYGVFSDEYKTKLEINNRKISGSVPIIWRANNIFLNNPCVKWETQMKFIKYFEQNKNLTE